MTHVEPTLQDRYTRCNRCSHIYLAALQHCDRCGAANTSTAEDKTAESGARLVANGRPTPRSARRWAVVFAGGGLAIATLATWFYGYDGWLTAFLDGAARLSANEEHPLKSKDVFKECEQCPEMVVVPAGSFMMGSPSDEKERDADEGPQHQVTFAKQFAVGRFSVTFAEWDACVSDGGCNGYRPSDEGWGRDRRPVINVSWDDAKVYVAWLSRKTGKTYRLLSEAEREYVTRARTQTPFWWGASITTRQANYDGNYAYNGGPKGEYRQRTLPVDTFEPNPWGLRQVHGNLWEWVEDCYANSYVGAPSDGSAWVTGDCSRRVLRGGSWLVNPWDLRSARRNWYYSNFRFNFYGFRVARTLTP